MRTTFAAASEPFGRDLDADYAAIARLAARASDAGADLLALPEAALGGYLSTLGGHATASDDEASRPDSLPPAIRLDGPELAHVRTLIGDLVVVLGICEADGPLRFNTAVAMTADGILGVHRKVHQPLGEHMSYEAGDTFAAFDSPVGRMGLMVCYDKAFPEGARTLAMDGAEVVVCISAWPAARTDPAPEIADDRWTRRFRLYDQARALENQVVWVASNQAGTFGSLRFVGSAAVIGPGGEVLAETGTGAGLAVASLDVAAALGDARRAMFALRDRRPDAYDLEAAFASA